MRRGDRFLISLLIRLTAIAVLCGVLIGSAEASSITLARTRDVNSFGESNSAYYAQSFRAIDDVARTLTFEMRTNAAGTGLGNTVFRLLITELTANDPPIAIVNQSPVRPGSVLFESGDLVLPADADWTTFSIDLGGLPLVEGRAYAWVLDSFVDWDGVLDARAAVGATRGDVDVYPDGELFFFNVANNGVDRAGHFGSPFWQSLSPSDHRDLAFQLDFGDAPPVPEPSSSVLVGCGCLIILCVLRSRSRSNARSSAERASANVRRP